MKSKRLQLSDKRPKTKSAKGNLEGLPSANRNLSRQLFGRIKVQVRSGI